MLSMYRHRASRQAHRPCTGLSIQTLYADGKNFESNPRLAFYLYQLLKHGVAVAVVTAAGYEYNVEKYEFRISGLLHYFQQRGLNEEECGRFYLVRRTL
jgi:IMP and pyridine-specific 5'-nucleotidase